MKIDEILKGKKFKYENKIFEITGVQKNNRYTIYTSINYNVYFDSLHDIDFIQEPTDEDYLQLHHDLYGDINLPIQEKIKNME